jgi:hypothetical protein
MIAVRIAVLTQKWPLHCGQPVVSSLPFGFAAAIVQFVALVLRLETYWRKICGFSLILGCVSSLLCGPAAVTLPTHSSGAHPRRECGLARCIPIAILGDAKRSHLSAVEQSPLSSVGRREPRLIILVIWITVPAIRYEHIWMTRILRFFRHRNGDRSGLWNWNRPSAASHRSVLPEQLFLTLSPKCAASIRLNLLDMIQDYVRGLEILCTN